MVESGIAIELQEEVMVSVEGNITESPTNSWGRKTKYLLTRPELLFFVDEVGSNTSQKKDGHIGGQTYVGHQTQHSSEPHMLTATSLCLGLPMPMVTQYVVL
jgi:hypothetical protein